MSRLPPGFGGGFSQSATGEQQNTFEMPGQSSVRQPPLPGLWGGQQQQQNNSIENNSSTWDLDSGFSALPVRRSASNTEIQANNTPAHDDKLESPGPGKSYNYAAAAASGGNSRKNTLGVNEGQRSQQLNNANEQQFRAPWVSNVGKTASFPSGPNPLSQLAAQQKELIKLQENLMQMMQSQANAGFKDPQVFMDLQRQQAIATAQLQSMQDAFRAQQQTVPSFPYSQSIVLGSWPLRQPTAQPTINRAVGNLNNDYKNVQIRQGQHIVTNNQESVFYQGPGQHSSRNRFNSGSSTGSAGYDEGSSQNPPRGAMTYGAVVAGNTTRTGTVRSSGAKSFGNLNQIGRDKRNDKRGQSPKGDNRRSIPEIPNEKDCVEGREKRTTLMIRNIPNKYTQTMLLEELNEVLHRKFDFFYLPIDFRKKTNMGYAFINMIDPVATVVLVKQFHGKGWRSSKSEKICQISYARIQGKHALVEQFRNSTVMSKKKQYRPIIFFSDGPSIGTSEPFPPGNNSSKQRV